MKELSNQDSNREPGRDITWTHLQEYTDARAQQTAYRPTQEHLLRSAATVRHVAAARRRRDVGLGARGHGARARCLGCAVPARGPDLTGNANSAKVGGAEKSERRRGEGLREEGREGPNPPRPRQEEGARARAQERGSLKKRGGVR